MTLIKKITINLIIGIFLLLSFPEAVLAANYGEGSYGEGAYNIGETLTSTSPPGTSSVGTPPCTDISPGSTAPWIYSASVFESNSILLKYTDWSTNKTEFVIEYGLESGKYIYSAIGISPTSTSHVIGSLNLNTTYYFRIRAGNGCATGAWSNELSATTRGAISFNKLEVTNVEISNIPEEKPSVPEEDIKTSPINNYNVNIKVLSTDNQPIQGARVALHSDVQEQITNEEGIAKFTNIEEGQHKLVISYNKYSGEQSINITGGSNEVNITITVEQRNVLISPFAGVIIGILVIIIVILLKKRNSHL